MVCPRNDTAEQERPGQENQARVQGDEQFGPSRLGPDQSDRGRQQEGEREGDGGVDRWVIVAATAPDGGRTAGPGRSGHDHAEKQHAAGLAAQLWDQRSHPSGGEGSAGAPADDPAGRVGEGGVQQQRAVHQEEDIRPGSDEPGERRHDGEARVARSAPHRPQAHGEEAQAGEDVEDGHHQHSPDQGGDGRAGEFVLREEPGHGAPPNPTAQVGDRPA